MGLHTTSQGTRKKLRAKLTTTNATTIYEGSSVGAYLDSINICNIGAVTATIDLWVNDGSTSFYAMKNYSMAAGESLGRSDLPIDVASGETLRVEASVANTFDVIGTMIEQAPQRGG